MMGKQTHVVRLLEKVPRVEDIVSFRFDRPADYRYEAGQWLVITFPGPATASDHAAVHTHHFSHSTSPFDPVLEFTTRLRGSEFKDALDALPLGAEMEIEGPYGAFTLPPEARKVVFITGGIGVTCVRSILRWLGQGWAGDPEDADRSTATARSNTADRSTPKDGAGISLGLGGCPGPPLGLQRIVLLLANRTEHGIAFREELDDLEERLPPLRVVHVLSEADAGWRGRRGHIDEHVLDDELAVPEGWAFFLSGPPSLVRSMSALLKAWGVDHAAMAMERFEGYE